MILWETFTKQPTQIPPLFKNLNGKRERIGLWILLFYFILLIFFSDSSKPIGISLWIRTKLPVGIGSNWAEQQSARVYCYRHSVIPMCHTTHGQTTAISNRQPQNVIAFVQIDID